RLSARGPERGSAVAVRFLAVARRLQPLLSRNAQRSPLRAPMPGCSPARSENRGHPMHTDRNESLVVLTAVSAERTARGGYRLTHKFLEGMAAYTRAWDGPVHAMFDPRSVDTGNLDLEEVSPHDVGFSIELVRF